MTRTIPILLLAFMAACIGTKPFGLRKVQWKTSRAFYTKGHPKEVVHTRRIYIKDCQGCKEIIHQRKKEWAENGRLIYREKVKRRMYTSKLYRIKSKTYYDNGQIKEKRKLVKGTGYIYKYDSYGKRSSTNRYKKGKPVGKNNENINSDDTQQ
ncbi:MAG TPA: hypothetical protein VI112_12070 [Bacteroidia bacterium]